MLGTLLIVDAVAPGEFGILTFGLAIQSLAFLVSSGAGRSVVVNDLAHSPETAGVTLAGYFAVGGALSTFFAVVGAGLALVLVPSFAEALTISVLLVGNVFASVNPIPAFDAEHRQSVTAGSRALSEGLALAVLAGLHLLDGMGVVSVALVFAGKWCLGSTLLIAAMWSNSRELHRPSRSYSLSLLRRWTWVATTAVLAQIPLVTGVLFVRFLVDEDDASIQGLVQTIAAAATVCASMLVRVLQPHVAGPFGLRPSFVVRVVVVYIGFASLLFCATLLATSFVVARWLPADYSPVSVSAGPLLGASVLSPACWLVAQYLLRLRKEWIATTAFGATAIGFVLYSLANTSTGTYWTVGWAALIAVSTTFAMLTTACIILARVGSE